MGTTPPQQLVTLLLATLIPEKDNTNQGTAVFKGPAGSARFALRFTIVGTGSGPMPKAKVLYNQDFAEAWC